MKRLIAQAMEDGAMGLSTALLQPPSSLATTANLIELAKTAKQYGGFIRRTFGMKARAYSGRLTRRSRSARAPGFRRRHPHEDRAQEALGPRQRDRRDGAEGARRGLDVRANVYPYTAGQNNLSSIVPPWAHDGGRERCSSGSRIQRRGNGCGRRS